MTEPRPAMSPVLGQPTDAEEVDGSLELDPAEETMDTPDELGGTGGEQAGGAG